MAKEKMNKELRVKVPQSLYEAFRKQCDKEWKSASVVVRELLVEYCERPTRINR